MAQYTPSSGDYCRPYRSPWGAFPTRGYQPISTSLRLSPGQLMTQGAAGSTDRHRVIADVTAAQAGQAAVNIVGICAETYAATPNSSATTPNAISVWEANPNVEFIAVNSGICASSNIGKRMPLVWDSTLRIEMIQVAISTATDSRVLITGILPGKTGNVDGDSGTYSIFRFMTHLGDQVGSTVMSSSPLLAFYS